MMPLRKLPSLLSLTLVILFLLPLARQPGAWGVRGDDLPGPELSIHIGFGTPKSISRYG